MQIEPRAEAFARAYAAGAAQVVWTTLVADLETPVSAFLKVAGGRPLSFLLESVEGGAMRGRYSIIGLDPDVVWRTNGDEGRDQPQRAHAVPTLSSRARTPPLAALRASSPRAGSTCRTTCRRWRPGVFGYLGYDMVRLMEELVAAQGRTRSAFPTRSWCARPW